MASFSEGNSTASNGITVLDCNEFWSPSGGGVRRYHLQKMEYFRRAAGVDYVFVMPDTVRGNNPVSESIGLTSDGSAVIEHVPAFKFPGNWEYRLAPSSATLRTALRKYRPDVIEIGSPYLLPGRIRGALKNA